MQTTIVEKKEIQTLKKKEQQIDLEIMAQFRRAMEDIKYGRIREWNLKEAKK